MYFSLKKKMVLSVVLAIFITSVTLLSIGYFTFQKQNWQTIETQSRDSLRATAKGVSDWFYSKQLVMKALRTEIEHNPDLNLISHLNQVNTSGGFSLSYYGTEQGQFTRHDPTLKKVPGYDPRARGWYQETKSAGHAITSDPYISVSMQSLVVALTEPVLQNGQLIGVVGSDLALAQLIKDILAIQVAGDGYAMLINRDGNIVAHPNESLLLKPISDIVSGLTMEQLNQASQAESAITTEINGQEKILMAQPIDHTNWLLVTEMDRAVLTSPLNAMLLNQVFIGFIVLLVMAAATSWFVARQLLELERVSQALADIAEGEGDLTRRLEVMSHDEVGQLAEKFNTFVERLHIMMIKVSEISGQLNHGADKVTKSAMTRSESIRQQQDEITMVATAVTQMASATAEIAGNADHTAQNANKSVELCQSGLVQMTQSQGSIHSLEKELNLAVEIMGELEAHAQQISTILSTIRGIAEQTNLLALNAAIEAARAGDQGRGFAVVADEVRVLSQRTHASTEEIQQKIQGLQKATSEAVAVISQSTTLVEESVKDVDLTGGSIKDIQQAVQTINNMSAQIAAAAEEQSAMTVEINHNTHAAREVSDSLASDAINAVNQAEHLNQLSGELEKEISRFKLRADNA